MTYLQRIKQKIFIDMPYPGIRRLTKMDSAPSTASQGERIYREYGLHFDDLRKAAGLEWSDIKDDPAALEDFAYSVHTRRLIDRGEVPPDYKYVAVCRGCGPVWLWFKGKLEGCPWCGNRLQGKPVPFPGETPRSEVKGG
jgi:hypothetical protein